MKQTFFKDSKPIKLNHQTVPSTSTAVIFKISTSTGRTFFQASTGTDTVELSKSTVPTFIKTMINSQRHTVSKSTFVLHSFIVSIAEVEYTGIYPCQYS